MKIDPHFTSLDICQPSMSLIKERAGNYLQEKFEISSLWVPDEDTQYLPYAPIQDVLLMGGFLNRFIETGNWTDTKYRLWVCSRAAKAVLTQLLGFCDSEISVLPRYKLFPKGLPKQISLAQKEINFVYAGRISPSKNIECLLRTVCDLQNRYDLVINLHMFGGFDNFVSPDRGRWEPFSYEDRIRSVTEQLPWRIKPIFHGRTNTQEWTQANIDNPLYINFSTFIFEDFSVALAQAQEQGWPFVVSNWGGFQDQQQQNGIMIPWQMIGRTDENSDLIQLKSEVLSKYLHFHLSQKAFSTNHCIDEIEDSTSPITVDTNRLDSLRRRFLSSLGPDSYLLTKENLDYFADTKSGRTFFSKYRLFFGAKTTGDSFRIIINDFNKKNTGIIKKSTEISLSSPCAQPIIFTPSRELPWPENLFSLSQDSEIHFSFNHPDLKNLIDFTKLNISKNCKLVIHESSDA